MSVLGQESEQSCTVCVSGIDMCLYLARKVSSYVQCVLVVSICVCTWPGKRVVMYSVVSGIDMCLYLARKVSSHVQCVSGIDMCLYLARKVSSHVQCVLVVSICVCT